MEVKRLENIQKGVVIAALALFVVTVNAMVLAHLDLIRPSLILIPASGFGASLIASQILGKVIVEKEQRKR